MGQAHWHGSIEKEGVVIYNEEGYMEDPFQALAMGSGDYGEENTARISSTVARSLPYAEVKVSFTVTVNCPQTTPDMQKAAYYAFQLATVCVNNSFGTLTPGLPPLNVPR